MRVERHSQSPQLRLAPGDIIRCAAFVSGLRWQHDPAGPIHVAWRATAYPDYHVRQGKASHADDPSRGTASFLIHSVTLVENDGPDDVARGEHRLSRDVVCVRLGDDDTFERHAERILFSLNEPMSVASPDQAAIEVVGYARLPIT